MELITFVLIASVTGYTFTLLMSPGEILDSLPILAYKFKLKPLQKIMQCEKCMAGQIALWGYPLFHFNQYDYQHHFIVIIFSIFVAHVIGKLIGE